MENINQIIGKNLLFLRKQKKLTQIELGEHFNYSDKSISKWESCESLPSIEVLYDLANFYGITLNDLVNENLSQTEIIEQEPVNEHKQKAFSAKLIITLLAISAVWILSTSLYVSFLMAFKTSRYMLFIWAVPLSLIVLIVFNAIWGRYKFLFMILSALLWTLLASVHLEVLTFGYNIWPIYLIGIPLQIAIILWGCLIKKPHLHNKKIRLERKLIRKEEKLKLKQEIQEIKNALKEKSDEDKNTQI